jgi:hypothetical protein
VTDPTRIDPFENRFTVKVKRSADASGSGGKRSNPPGSKPGKEREVPGGIALPNIIPVYEKDWETHTPPFDKFTALQIKDAGDDSAQNGDAKPIFDFYINMDNLYLQSEIKPAHRDPEVTRARFTYGLVLLGLALVQEHETATATATKADAEENEDEDEGEANIERRVAEFTRAIAPVLLPMIESLGDLDEDPVPAIVGSGDAT